jgi:hypothetical protein
MFCNVRCDSKMKKESTMKENTNRKNERRKEKATRA